MKRFLILLVLVLFIGGCGDKEMSNKKDTLDAILASGEYIVVDVRTNSEYESGHVVGALNIPHDQINEDIVLDKDKTILVYCMSGARSKIAYDTLTSMGYNTYDMGAFSNVDLPKE